MDNDRATVDKGSLPVSMAPTKKQPGIAIYQAKKAKVGRPKQVKEIKYRIKKYFSKQVKGDLDEDKLGDLMEVIEDDLNNMNMK